MVSPGEIRKRVAGDTSRPLLNISKEKTIKDLLSQCLPFYRKADICADADGKTPREVAREIVRLAMTEGLKL